MVKRKIGPLQRHKVKCSCGNDTFKIYGEESKYPVQTPKEIILCAKCNKQINGYEITQDIYSNLP